MKTSLLVLVSAIISLASCSNNHKAVAVNPTDTVGTIDTVKKTDTVTKDAVAVTTSDREKDEERDQKIMDDILKKRKTMK